MNLDEHDPEKCSEKYESWNAPGGAQCAAPKFAAFPSTSHWWMVVSLLAYSMEILLRMIHWANPAKVETFTFHPSNVLELRLRKKLSVRGNSHEVGQYVQIKINEASYFEWHPFTLTSAPEDGFFMIHMRQAGDWTSKVQQIFHDCHTRYRFLDFGVLIFLVAKLPPRWQLRDPSEPHPKMFSTIRL